MKLSMLHQCIIFRVFILAFNVVILVVFSILLDEKNKEEQKNTNLLNRSDVQTVFYLSSLLRF